MRGARTVLLAAAAFALVAPAVLGAGWHVEQAEPAQTPSRTVYTAQSLFSVKQQIEINRMWIFARPLWLAKPTGEGVTIGVIDTGADLRHPDLAGKLACGWCWRDFVGDRTGTKRAQPYDDHGHGTHIAGIAAGHGHLQLNPLHYYWLTGARGIAPEAKLVVAKAMNHKGEGDDPVVANAIRWAVDPNGDGDLSDGADVINLSIGIEEPKEGPAGSLPAVRVGSETRAAILDAIRKGVVIVVSSGNDGQPRVSEPGDIPEVITVAAADKDNVRTDFSNHGADLDLLAPGVIVSAYPRGLDTFDFAQDGYVGMAGTSMAAPVVTGIVALMMEANPALRQKAATGDHTQKVARIQAILKDNAVRPDDAPRSVGLVSAHRSVVSVDQGTSRILPGLPEAVLAVLALVALAVGLLIRRRRREEREIRELLQELERPAALPFETVAPAAPSPPAESGEPAGEPERRPDGARRPDGS